MKNKKLKLGIAGLVVVALIGGTLAYFNQTLTAVNTFDTGKYSTTLVETFKPEDGNNWEPGMEVNKDVEVVNTGDQPVVVRVKFDEAWSRLAAAPFKTILANDDLSPAGKDVYFTNQLSATDGLTTLDSTVVQKNLITAGWTLDTDDGWWYYNSILEPTISTGKFLDSVKLISDLDIGLYTVTTYYSTAATAPTLGTYDANPLLGWTLYTGILPETALHSTAVTVLDPTKMGYSDADYALTITVQTVQATNAAVTSIFGNSIPVSPAWVLADETL